MPSATLYSVTLTVPTNEFTSVGTDGYGCGCLVWMATVVVDVNNSRNNLTICMYISNNSAAAVQQYAFTTHHGGPAACVAHNRQTG